MTTTVAQSESFCRDCRHQRPCRDLPKMPENDHVRHVQQSYNGVIFTLFLGGIGVLKFYAKPVSESCTCSSAGPSSPRSLISSRASSTSR